MSEPVISIICNTFNQEKYIAEALDSFLMQKVNVPFEILVHDDASTDRTSEIVREYEAKYPDIIKPIYQTENQYSKGVSITPEIQIPRAKGKYIAFCEGDDYWTDENKLQIQLDFMEENADYTICCHAYNMVNKDRSLIEERFDFSGDCDVSMKRLIGNQLLVPQFATLFVRYDCISKFKGEFLGRKSSDMIIRIFCATEGKMRYFNKNMSCYRRFTETSWTVRVGKNTEKMVKGLLEGVPFLEKLNAHTNFIYNEDIKAAIDDRYFQAELLENKYREARKRKAFKIAPVKRKVYIIAGCIFPNLITKIRNK